MWNLWELRSTQGVTEVHISDSDEEHKEVERGQDVMDKDVKQDEGLIGAVGGIPAEEQPEEDETKEKQPDIIVPFHSSQMNIPLLRPNVLMTSDVGSTAILLSTELQQSDSAVTATETVSEAQEQDIDPTQQRSSDVDPNPSQTFDNQESADDELRLPRPLTDRREKYPKDEKNDDPIVISPAALGGTSYRITSNVPQMPIGYPRNYEVLERYKF